MQQNRGIKIHSSFDTIFKMDLVKGFIKTKENHKIHYCDAKYLIIGFENRRPVDVEKVRKKRAIDVEKVRKQKSCRCGESKKKEEL